MVPVGSKVHLKGSGLLFVVGLTRHYHLLLFIEEVASKPTVTYTHTETHTKGPSERFEGGG